jgi:putative tricarboxylic transport membrane protein
LSPIAPSDLSAVAVLFEEYIVATVVPDSPIKSGRDLLERLKKDPSSVNVGVPSLTGGGNFAILMAAKAAGVEPKRVKTVVFKSGGDSMTALLGGHIDVMMSTTAAPLAQLKQGKVRIVAVAAPKRLPGLLADVPTWSEQGARVVFSNWRGIVGPQGLKRPQVQYWEGVFEKLVKEPQFQEDLARNMWVENFKRSDEMRKFLKEDYDELKVLLTELGMAK